MQLALFDLDDTLILGDSEVLWSQYLDRHGVYDMSEIDRFMDEYGEGTLDFQRFMDFMLAPLAATPFEELEPLRAHFLSTEIEPRLANGGLERIEAHRQDGHTLLAISAAHDFLAAPIAELCGLEEGLFTTAERDGMNYTGRVAGVPCFREGKVASLSRWLGQHDLDWSGVEASWFYSDSHNDLPLLSQVHTPVAVRPDPRLRAVAASRGWEIVESW